MQQPTEHQNHQYETNSYEFMTEKGLLYLETGMMPFGQREHPLEAKLSNLEAQQLGYHSLEYEAYINLFDEKESLIGGVQLQRRWNVAKMFSLWIDPEFRGLGLGKVIMEHSETLSLMMAANAIMLETSTLHNYDFYLQHGFSITNTFDDIIPGELFYTMIKNLQRPKQGECE